MYSHKNLFIVCSLFVFILFTFGSIFAQDDMHQHDMNKNSKEMNMDQVTVKSDKSMEKVSKDKKDDNSIVRKGTIDLKKIDANKDGKVYQDMMDYNVISDKAGKCPLCGMTLKEVSLKEAKENLVNSGFKVK